MKLSRRNFLKAAGVGGLAACSLPARHWLYAQEKGFLQGRLAQVAEHTTLAQTWLPAGHGTWQRAPGQPLCRPHFSRKVLLPPRQTSSLLFFAQITDSHIVDEESPGRLVAAEPYLNQLNLRSAFHPQEDLTLQVLDAMIRTIDDIARATRLDFVLNTGDAVDNTQANELQWFLDTMHGHQWVDPDSGADENPSPALDANDRFQPAGLPADLPWYSVLGNHDVLLQGNIPQPLLGLFNWLARKYCPFLEIKDHTGSYSNAVITPWLVPPRPEELQPGPVMADARRKPLSVRAFIQQHLNYSRGVTQGFPATVLEQSHACYSVVPRPEIPVRLICLDTVNRLGYAGGVLPTEQVQNFLIPHLEQAQQQAQLVVVVSHHPSKSIISLGQLSAHLQEHYGQHIQHPAMRQMFNELLAYERTSRDGYSGKELVQLLRSYPNVILHVAGHTHANEITWHAPDPGQDASHGYWEVQTSALLTYPQQARLFEILYHGNGQGTIQTCVLDHNAAPGSLAALSRQRAYEDSHPAGEYVGDAGTAADRNALLAFVVPATVRTVLER